MTTCPSHWCLATFAASLIQQINLPESPTETRAIASLDAAQVVRQGKVRVQTGDHLGRVRVSPDQGSSSVRVTPRRTHNTRSRRVGARLAARGRAGEPPVGLVSIHHRQPQRERPAALVIIPYCPTVVWWSNMCALQGKMLSLPLPKFSVVSMYNRIVEPFINGAMEVCAVVLKSGM